LVWIARKWGDRVGRCEYLTWWYFWGMFVLEGGGYCFVPDESYLTKKMSPLPDFVFPSKSP